MILANHAFKYDLELPDRQCLSSKQVELFLKRKKQHLPPQMPAGEFNSWRKASIFFQAWGLWWLSCQKKTASHKKLPRQCLSSKQVELFLKRKKTTSSTTNASRRIFQFNSWRKASIFFQTWWLWWLSCPKKDRFTDFSTLTLFNFLCRSSVDDELVMVNFLENLCSFDGRNRSRTEVYQITSDVSKYLAYAKPTECSLNELLNENKLKNFFEKLTSDNISPAGMLTKLEWAKKAIKCLSLDQECKWC